MSSKANNLLMATAFMSTAHGFWVTSGLFTALPLLFDLNVFSMSNEQPDDAGIYSIIELVLAGCSFLIGMVGAYGIIGSKNRIANSTSQFILGAFFTIFAVVQLILLFLRLNARGVLADMGWNDGVGTCADHSFTGCPIARYEHANFTIETISDCKFNAFDLNNVNNQDIGGATILVDWSNVFNYDSVNAAVLATAANSGGTLEVDAAAMPNIGHCWYWGCNEVCHPRSKLNQAWITYAMLSSGVYIILSILSFVAGSKISKEEELLTDKKDDVESQVLIAPDDDDTDGWSNKVSSSSVRLENFKLRM